MRSLLTLLFLVVAILRMNGQSKTIVSGYISDQASGEKLVGVNVYLPITKKGTLSNQQGFYSIIVDGPTAIEFSLLGYEKRVEALGQTGGIVRHDVVLKFNNVLQEVTVTAPEEFDIVESTQMGANKISTQLVNRSTILLGESDIMKTIQLLPGVKGGNEGFAGVYVRGGSPDQNLTLLDGIPVYNINHLFGFISTFNTDAIKDVTVIKGGIPARYGTRLSSVIDITLNEGDSKSIKGSFSMSPLAGKLLLQGPVIKKKASFLASFRRSWFDLPVKIVSNSQSPTYLFYDFNFKYNHTIGKRDKLIFSVYGGKDSFSTKYKAGGEKASYGFSWSNWTYGLRWNRIIGNNAFLTTLFYYGRFGYEQEFTTENSNGTQFRKTNSKIQDLSVETRLDWASRVGSMKMGVKLSRLTFAPEVLYYLGIESLPGSDMAEKQPAFQAEIFVEDDFKLHSHVLINVGVRNSLFVTDSTAYNIFQPRISAAYLFNQRASLKISFNRNAQFLHLLTNTSLGLPTDLWLPATSKVKPEESYQTAISYNLKIHNDFELSIESYYKTMNNVIEYKDGANYLFGINENWEDKITIGKGLSYGLEFLLTKKRGAVTGWIAYTLSYTNRTFDDLNGGQPFLYKYDRRHDLSILSTYSISSKKSLTAIFVLNSGNRLTLPVGGYQGLLPPGYEHTNRYQAGYIDDFANQQLLSSRNNFQMPTYHRMDINYQTSKITRRKNIRTWIFSVYNLYNRKNAFAIYPTSNGEIKKLTLFPILPSISYKLVF